MDAIHAFIYWNSRKKTFSVRAEEGIHKGKVITHLDYVALSWPVAKVSVAGRERVRREKRKTVHAGILGILTAGKKEGITPGALQKLDSCRIVSYNPYINDTFVFEDTGEPYKNSDGAYLYGGKIYIRQ